MPISAIVITAANESGLADIRAALQREPRIEPGQPTGRRLPAVLEAEDDRQARQLHDWIGALPGVALVDVIAVYFDTTAAAAGSGAPHER